MIKVTDRTLTTLITLTGVRATGYTVRVSGFDGMSALCVMSHDSIRTGSR